MNYTISRDGQEFGPYSLADLHRYVASGNIVLTDLARGEGQTAWVPVAQILNPPQTQTPIPPTVPPAYVPAYAPAAAQPSLYPDPPNLNWGLLLLLVIVTGGIFMWIWDLVQATWVRKIQPASNAVIFYAIATVLTVIGQGMKVAHLHYHGSLYGFIGAILFLIGRFNLRGSLEQHYNTAEPIGLRLSGVMTFFFGGLYFQYHFNKINRMKQTGMIQ